MSIWLCLVVAAATYPYQEAFERANAAYASRDYAAAINGYEQLIEESVTGPAVFFNLGNAYYRTGRLGAAIANYERALACDPGMECARENLDKCVLETERRLERPLPPDWEQSLLFWHYNLAPAATRMLAILFWLLFWLLLAIRKVRPVRYVLRAAFIVGVLAVAFAVSAWVKAHGDVYAVADAATVPVHYGTSDKETVRFELYEGDRVLVDRRASAWARVMTADGERGWAKEDALAFVGPPYERLDRPPADTGAEAKETP